MSDKPKHTPGPWRFEPIGHETLYLCHCIIASGDSNIASVWCPEGNAEQLANSALISASPDMFEAMEALLAICETDCDEPEECQTARAALAKARGEKENGK